MALALGRSQSILTPPAMPNCSTPKASASSSSKACATASHALQRLLFADADAPSEDQRRHAAATSRKLALLHTHRLIRTVTTTYQYHLTVLGRIVATALITARNTSTKALTKLPARQNLRDLRGFLVLEIQGEYCHRTLPRCDP